MATVDRARAIVAMAHRGRRARVADGLRRDGWVVRVADDGYDLVHLMEKALLSDDAGVRPDLIIADATLHGLMGLSVLQGIRQLEWTTPVIVLVDFNQPRTVELARELGATRVFEKPVDPDEVCRAARELSPRHRSPTGSRGHADEAA